MKTKMITEKPIIFKPEMIRALQKNKKTVTRRLVDPQPPGFVDWLEYIGRLDDSEKRYFRGYMQPGEPTVHHTKAKYWPLLNLWVRETFMKMTCPANSLMLNCKEGENDDGWYKHGNSLYYFKADDTSDNPDDSWSSPLFLPRIASRFLLKITDVKIERLHELDDIDAILEGCKNRVDYARLWNEINGKSGYTWDKNPWVYRIQFENMGANYGGN